jgi:hypothetical protein
MASRFRILTPLACTRFNFMLSIGNFCTVPDDLLILVGFSLEAQKLKVECFQHWNWRTNRKGRKCLMLCREEFTMLKTYFEVICDDEQFKMTSSVVVILLNDVVKLRISHHMEGEKRPQG